MPEKLVWVIVLLIVMSWFLIGEKKSFKEKLLTLSFFVIVYLLYKSMNDEKILSFLESMKARYF